MLADNLEITLQTCTVCICPMVNNLSALSCGHIFHTACLEMWKKDCPSCREPRKNLKTISLFLDMEKKKFDDVANSGILDDSREHISRLSCENSELLSRLSLLHQEFDDVTKKLHQETLQNQSKNKEIEKHQNLIKNLETSIEKLETVKKTLQQQLENQQLVIGTVQDIIQSIENSNEVMAMEKLERLRQHKILTANQSLTVALSLIKYLCDAQNKVRQRESALGVAKAEKKNLENRVLLLERELDSRKRLRTDKKYTSLLSSLPSPSPELERLRTHHRDGRKRSTPLTPQQLMQLHSSMKKTRNSEETGDREEAGREERGERGEVKGGRKGREERKGGEEWRGKDERGKRDREEREEERENLMLFGDGDFFEVFESFSHQKLGDGVKSGRQKTRDHFVKNYENMMRDDSSGPASTRPESSNGQKKPEKNAVDSNTQEGHEKLRGEKVPNKLRGENYMEKERENAREKKPDKISGETLGEKIIADNKAGQNTTCRFLMENKAGQIKVDKLRTENKDGQIIVDKLRSENNDGQIKVDKIKSQTKVDKLLRQISMDILGMQDSPFSLLPPKVDQKPEKESGQMREERDNGQNKGDKESGQMRRDINFEEEKQMTKISTFFQKKSPSYDQTLNHSKTIIDID